MRILHILDHSAPLHSGYTFRTLSIMRTQRQMGWEPVPITGPKQGSGTLTEQFAEGWTFYRTPDVTGRVTRWPVLREAAEMRALQARIEAIAESLRPDIIHAHSPVLNGLPALRLARRFGLPLVYEVRAFWEDAAVEHGTTRADGLRYRASRAAESFVLRRADAVVTICDGLREAIVARGVDDSRVSVVANAVDLAHFHVDAPVDHALLRALDLEGAFVLGFAGSFYAYEGLSDLIKAVKRLRADGRQVKLLLVGGGPEEQRLRAMASDLGLSDAVCFTGRIDHADIARYYSLIDLLVYPRVRQRLTELVTPLKPLEAMAQGKLVAASDVGGHRELIADGKTGFLFTPESSEALATRVQDVIDTDRRILDAMRRRAREYVERERTWARSVAVYESVYRRLVGDQRLPVSDGGVRS